MLKRYGSENSTVDTSKDSFSRSEEYKCVEDG